MTAGVLFLYDSRRSRGELYLAGGYFRDGFVAIKENSKDVPLPEGTYIVRLIEEREGRYGNYPYVSMLKRLPDNLSFLETVLCLSELALHTQRELLTLLDQIFTGPKEKERAVNLLNCIAIADRKEALIEKEPLDDSLLKELEINYEEVRHAYEEILRDRQSGQSEDFPGGLSTAGKPAKREKRGKDKSNSASMQGQKSFLDSSKKGF